MRAGTRTWLAPKGAVKDAVIAAVKIGYRAIDCAAMYGNEGEVGEAIQSLIGEGIVTRKDLFITSKIMGTDSWVELAPAAIEKSLSLLKV